MHNGGLIILDVSVPESPQLEGQLDTILYGDDIEIIGGYAVVLGQYLGSNGFHVIDVDPPSSPFVADTYYELYEGIAISADGQYVYAVQAHAPYQFDIIDISDPLNLPFTPAGSYVLPAQSGYFDMDIAVSGDYALMTAGMAGRLHILDISDLTSISPLGTYDMPGRAASLCIQGDLALVTGSWDYGFQILDISDIRSLGYLGRYDSTFMCADVAMSDNYAFACDYVALQVVDLTLPSAPTTISSLDALVPFEAYNDIEISGPYGFVAFGDGGVQILSVSNPHNPYPLIVYDTLGGTTQLQISGKHAFVADGDNGLVILDLTPCFE